MTIQVTREVVIVSFQLQCYIPVTKPNRLDTSYYHRFTSVAVPGSKRISLKTKQLNNVIALTKIAQHFLVDGNDQNIFPN